MSEIKKEIKENADGTYTITDEHTIADIVRWLLTQGADKQEILDVFGEIAPQQEPVAYANKVIGGRKWLSIHVSKDASNKWLEYRRKEQAWKEQYEQFALYTNPPQRQWVGLEAEDRLCAKYMQDAPDGIEAVIDYLEAKLKQKNGYAEEKNT